ncbi:MAG TPA: wax ester/triacylglycerol synthase family O-acyltransferase [Actinomycetota bacterium]|jgi:WS/DGAT/MGAT family acyltransferase|nr:wax ester/triacylglycerol synthase family O-acyltransferase [Actinomycetota bacterium]
MERLTAADLAMVWPEDFGWPQDIGVLAVIDGSGLVDADGGLAIEHVRDRIARRLDLLPRSRQVLVIPRRGLGWPLWADAPSFDLAEHVGVLPLGRRADEAQLLAACAELFARPLDRSRPLWRLWLLPGLPQGRIGLFMKLHHAVADGIAGVAAFGAFLDLSADVPAPQAPPWTPAPLPSTRELLGDNLRRRLHGLRRAGSRLAHPAAAARQARRGWPVVREAFAEQRAPRTSLNRPIGSQRRLAVVRSDLDLVKRIAHGHGATVNDVLLAAVAGGLRELLRGRGETVEGVVLRSFVPVSLHREQPDQARGNLDGAMVVPLPIGEPDPARGLRLIAAETAERKRKPRPPGSALFWCPAIQRAFLRHLPRQRFMNVYVANVPGPPVPLYLAGAPLLEVFPAVPIMGNMTLGVGALSYAGQFNITVVADRQACPDIEVFAEGARRSLDALAASPGDGLTGGGQRETLAWPGLGVTGLDQEASVRA